MTKVHIFTNLETYTTLAKLIMKTISTIWQYGNFTMEMVTEGAGTNLKEGVTEFEEGIDINPTVFEVPKDVDIKETKSPY